MRGVSVTDLPLRQALYFGNANDHFLLTSYNDSFTTEFWSVLQEQFPTFIPSAEEEKNYLSNSCAKQRLDHREELNVRPASV